MFRWLRLVVVFYTLSLTGCTAGSVLEYFFGADNSDDAYGRQRPNRPIIDYALPADVIESGPQESP